VKTIIAYITIFLVLLAIVPPRPFDFTAIYNGASALHAGISPYDRSVTERNQSYNYGRLALTYEDEIRVAHPLTSMLMLYPLGWAEQETAKQLFIAGSGLLFIAGLHYLGASLWWACLMFFLLREPISGFFLGQLALLSAAAVIWGLASIKRGKLRAAQLWMVLASTHPVLSVPLALIVLPRRRLYLCILAAIGLLMLTVDNLWPLHWIENMRAYPSYVTNMVWMPSISPIFVPLSLALMSMRGYSSTVAGLTLILPVTGVYHMSLYAPVFIKPSIAVLVFIILLWCTTTYPLNVRKVMTLLMFASFSVIYALDLPTLDSLKERLRLPPLRRLFHIPR
jgi:hypothetical protein